MVLQLRVESSVLGLSPMAQENPYEGKTQPVIVSSGAHVDAVEVKSMQQ
jgi:hypothetical protein